MTHNGLLTIKLDAIQRNWLRLRDQVGGAVKCSAVVKADAYGLGARPVSQALYNAGCRHFFVATLEEGLHIQDLLGDSSIYILGGVRPGQEHDCIAAGFIPVLSTLEQLNRWSEARRFSNRTAPSAIKVDTGMTRLGLDLEDFRALCEQKLLIRSCNPVLFMSHLACADDPEHPLNRQQLDSFIQAQHQIVHVVPDISCTFANSSGIFLGADWHFDLVRPGAALYGFNPQPGKNNPMEPTAELSLPILQIREIKQAVSVGYSASQQLGRGARLAVAFGGYADGIHRILGRQGRGFLAGIPVPVAGRICMDTTIFDITAVPENLLPALGEGTIQILCPDRTLEQASTENNALGYEVLTSLRGRYQRRYVAGRENDRMKSVELSVK